MASAELVAAIYTSELLSEARCFATPELPAEDLAGEVAVRLLASRRSHGTRSHRIEWIRAQLRLIRREFFGDQSAPRADSLELLEERDERRGNHRPRTDVLPALFGIGG